MSKTNNTIKLGLPHTQGNSGYFQNVENLRAV